MFYTKNLIWLSVLIALTTSAMENPIKLPLKEVPAYLFANPTQGQVYNWNATQLDPLKKYFAEITSTKLVALKKKTEKDQEAYCWIHSLLCMQKKFLTKPIATFSINDIKELNKSLTISITDKPGEIRALLACWPIRDLSQSEQNLLFILNQKHPGLVEQASLQGKPIGLDPKSLKTLNEKYMVQNSGATLWEDTFIDSLTGLDGVINVSEWLRGTQHVFTHPQKINPLLSEMLKTIAVMEESLKDPIEIAAYVWFETVRIHPFYEANKRTGRALASIILMQHGYRPPLITSEDVTGYVKDGLEQAIHYNNKEPFYTFVRRIVERQNN